MLSRENCESSVLVQAAEARPFSGEHPYLPEDEVREIYDSLSSLGKSFTSAGAGPEVLEKLAGGVSLFHFCYDYETALHGRRVSAIAEAIAAQLEGCSPEAGWRAKWAGMVHDLGKIVLSPSWLHRDAYLSSEEYEIVKKHPGNGADLIRVAGLTPFAEGAIQHHERLNGRGYPLGLKGNGISMEAKILAVADVLDAKTCWRPYRKEEPSQLREELLSLLYGTRLELYDREVVKAAVEAFDRGRNVGLWEKIQSI